jgi:hypothetical protein
VPGFKLHYRVTFEAAAEDADGVPPPVRLRHALKRAWRSGRLKCMRAEQLRVVGGWGAVDGSLPLRDGDGI